MQLSEGELAELLGPQETKKKTDGGGGGKLAKNVTLLTTSNVKPRTGPLSSSSGSTAEAAKTKKAKVERPKPGTGGTGDEEDGEKEDVIIDERGRIQSKLNSIVTVKGKRPDAKVKKRERDEQKRQREEEEKEKLDEEGRLKRQKEEEEQIIASELAERLYQMRREREKQLYDKRTLIVKDGTEKPVPFSTAELVDMVNDINGNRGGGGNNETELTKRDQALDVSEYYAQGVFPLDFFVDLVTHGGRDPLQNCEMGFVVNDIWWRNKRFHSPGTLRTFLQQTKPTRIDIGSTHASSGIEQKDKEKQSHSNIPLKKYLVFDVDIEDRSPTCTSGYLRKCSCKKKKTLCTAGCWFYMKAAIQCLTYLLRSVFDCKFIVPVFSGGRGVHLWVLDEQYLYFTEEQRKGMVERLGLYKNPRKYWHEEHSVYLYDLILKEYFYQRFLDNTRLIEMSDILHLIIELVPGGVRYIPNGTIETLSELQCCGEISERKKLWASLCSILDAVVPKFERAFIFRVLFPVLDKEVTTRFHHFIKTPFAIHPGTKRCSVPIPDIDTWTPDMAPRISELVESPAEIEARRKLQLQQQQQQQDGSSNNSNWKTGYDNAPETFFEKTRRQHRTQLDNLARQFSNRIREAYPLQMPPSSISVTSSSAPRKSVIERFTNPIFH